MEAGETKAIVSSFTEAMGCFGMDRDRLGKPQLSEVRVELKSPCVSANEQVLEEKMLSVLHIFRLHAQTTIKELAGLGEE